MNGQMLQACKDLIDDARTGCVDLVFKEICLEILARASHVLSKRQFKLLVTYASEKMKERNPFEFQRVVTITR